MTRARDLLSIGGFCIALAACATRGGGPSAAAIPAVAQNAAAPLTLDTPISEICDDPRGRAVLDRNLPDLRKNRNYLLFEDMSLRQLADMSGGKITKAKLKAIRLDLAAATGSPAAPARTH